MILVIVDRLLLSKLATYEPVLGVPPVDRQSPKFLLQAAKERFRRMAENALREPGCGLPHRVVKVWRGQNCRGSRLNLFSSPDQCLLANVDALMPLAILNG